MQRHLKQLFSAWRKEGQYSIKLRASCRELRHFVLRNQLFRLIQGMNEEQQLGIARAETHFASKALQAYFSALRRLAVVNRALRLFTRRRKQKQLKNYFHRISRHTQLSVVQGKKEIHIRRTTRKTVLHHYFSKWQHKYQCIHDTEQLIRNFQLQQKQRKLQLIVNCLRARVAMKLTREEKVRRFPLVRLSINFALWRSFTNKK